MSTSLTPTPFLLGQIAQLADSCNTDERFGEWGKNFSGVISLECDGSEAWLDVDGGQVRAVGLNPVERYAIGISGELSAWEQIWSGLPGGLHRAWRHRLLRFRGDQSALMRHYKMVWRLGDLMAQAGWGAR